MCVIVLLIAVCVCVCRTLTSPEAAIDDEEDGDEEGGHLAGVNQGVGPAEEEERKHRPERI